MGNYMNPIPDDTWPSFLSALRKRGIKYVMLARLGVETGLRVSDMLKLQIFRLRANLCVVEGKTQKEKRCHLSAELINDISAYAKAAQLKNDDYFIPSSWHTKNKPLSRIQAYRVFKASATEVGLSDTGPHSLRKTYAQHLFRELGNLEAVQKAMGHKHIETTLRYFMDVTKILPEK